MCVRFTFAFGKVGLFLLGANSPKKEKLVMQDKSIFLNDGFNVADQIFRLKFVKKDFFLYKIVVLSSNDNNFTD